METQEPKRQYRPGVHVHLYLWIAVVAVSLVPFLIISGRLFDEEHAADAFAVFLAMVAGLQGLLWIARRRCASESLGMWNGWLYVTGSMTMGIGGASMLIAIPCAAVAVLATAGIGLASLFDSDVTRAQSRFRRLVSWFVRNRMYQ